MASLEWSPLTVGDLPSLSSLARACLRRDGGLPTLADPAVLGGLVLTGQAIGGRDDSGEIVAAVNLLPEGERSWVAFGLVHPEAYRQGHGEALASWVRAHVTPGDAVRLRLESVSPEAEAFCTAIGLTRVFAERVMRHSLEDIPVVRRPEGCRTERFTPETASAFHTAYRRAFATRPGFPDTPYAEWVAWLEDDPHFRPELSRVALAGDEPVGFVTVSTDWVDQVGVAPDWRGRGLGGHLVVRSLRTLRKHGSTQAWLTVNVDNPSGALYERLGFVDVGLRARYANRAALDIPVRV